MKKVSTTTKEFKAQVQEHILNGLLDAQELKEGYDIVTTSEDLQHEQLDLVVREFNDWYSYNSKRIPNRQDAFTDWLDGLPSVLNTEHEYYKVYEVLENWCNAVGGTYTRNEKDPSKDYEFYKKIVYREFRTLCKKNDVQI